MKGKAVEPLSDEVTADQVSFLVELFGSVRALGAAVGMSGAAVHQWTTRGATGGSALALREAARRWRSAHLEWLTTSLNAVCGDVTPHPNGNCTDCAWPRLDRQRELTQGALVCECGYGPETSTPMASP